MYYNQNSELRGLRVAKYIRCSHDDQVAHGDTLQAQEDILNEFIMQNHLVLVDTFVDEALTARKKYTKRKEFIRLLEGVKRHDFDLIIFTKLDRWFRNIGDYHKIQEVLEAHNVQWKAVTENYDTTTTNGRLHINIRLSVAQDECDRDSDRIKDVFAHKLKNRTFCSGSLPRGLKLDEEKHVIIDEEWKQFALDMFDHFEATCSKRDTLLFLMQKYDMYLCYDSIARNLKNPLYKGHYRGDDQFCPALIAPERFDRIQKLRVRNVKRRHNNYTYIFTGLCVCAECGHALVGNRSHRFRKDGTEVSTAYYRCNLYAAKVCSHQKNINEEKLEKKMLEAVRPALSAYIAEYELTTAATVQKNPAAEAAKIKRKLQKLYDLFMNDLIDRDMYESEYQSFQKQLSELACAPVQSNDMTELKKLLEGEWEEVYMTFSNQEKNAFWKSFVDKIGVNNEGDIDIAFL